MCVCVRAFIFMCVRMYVFVCIRTQPRRPPPADPLKNLIIDVFMFSVENENIEFLLLPVNVYIDIKGPRTTEFVWCARRDDYYTIHAPTHAHTHIHTHLRAQTKVLGLCYRKSYYNISVSLQVYLGGRQ